MALFNKLFSSRKKSQTKNQDNVCGKLFAFSNDQVRVVLFRDCDYRGRKLLFDSTSVEKVPLKDDQTQQFNLNESKKFLEVYNGHGFVFTKPNSDTPQLGEMIFGSVTMSYRGSCCKMHSLKEPPRLMCTQVFPSPRRINRNTRSSAPSQVNSRESSSLQSLDNSVKFYDSNGSSTTSCSEQLSVNSGASDTLLVCKRNRSVPLDVPSNATNGWSNIPRSNVVDSGCGGDHSCSSFGSGPNSIPMLEATLQGHKFSCGSLKRWLRSASTSLEHSVNSLTGSASADECYLKSRSRSDMLGLAIIIRLTEGQERNMEQFFLEHAALIESMAFRARQNTEIAYTRSSSFISLMLEITNTSSQWLKDFLSGPQLNAHLWLTFNSNCDNKNSISPLRSLNEVNISKCDNETFFELRSHQNKVDECDVCKGKLINGCENQDQVIHKCKSLTVENKINVINRIASACVSDVSRTSQSETLKNNVPYTIISDDYLNKSNGSYELHNNSDFIFFNLSKFFKADREVVNCKKINSEIKQNDTEVFIKEFCELLDTIDCKHTNFFMSTLITAVLTHHLGWVSTVHPLENDEDISKLSETCNPLWDQLTDLYGAIGYPTKVAHTIISGGASKSEIIVKVLNVLTYFIRCCNLTRQNLIRTNAKEDNEIAYEIFKRNSCIPKEYYKKYEDHLREMEISSENFVRKSSLENSSCWKNSSQTTTQKNIEKITLKNSHEKNTLENFSENINYSSEDSNKNISLVKENVLNTINNEIKSNLCNGVNTFQKPGMKKTSTFLKELSNLEQHEDKDCKENEICNNKYEILNKINSLGIQVADLERKSDLEKKPKFLYRLENKEKQNLIDIQEAREQIEKVFSPKKILLDKQKTASEFVFEHQEKIAVHYVKSESNYFENRRKNSIESQEEKGVVFVLGENEKLLGLKKNDTKKKIKDENLFEPKENVETCKQNKIGEDCVDFHSEKLSWHERKIATRPSNLKLTLRNEEQTNCAPNIPQTSGLKRNKTFHALELGCSKESKLVRPSSLKIPGNMIFYCESSDSSAEENYGNNFLENSIFKDEDFQKQSASNIKPSNSCANLKFSEKKEILQSVSNTNRSDETGKRAQSVPPVKEDKTEVKEGKSRYKYYGVKFNFHQYPQIWKNYLKSQNLEVSNLSFAEKAMELSKLSANFNLPSCEVEYDEGEALQTPSNASELEFTNEISSEDDKNKLSKDYGKSFLNGKIEESENEDLEEKSICTEEEKNVKNLFKVVELPMPKSSILALNSELPLGYTKTLMRGLSDRYISDMVLQGTSAPKSTWESVLKKDLVLSARQPLLDQPVQEAVAIIGNVENWEVNLMSSHTYVIDKDSSGVRVGMSQLVANMLESLLELWKSRTPPEYCLIHIEHRLREFCLRSKALAQLLLDMDFCSMEILTSTLQLEVNDVPLLMAIASTHTPQVMQKYGLSFH